MSLIHEALKKAQGNSSAPPGSGLSQFQDSLKGEKKPPSMQRILVLALVLALALGYFAYRKLSSPSQPTAQPLQQAGQTATPTPATGVAALQPAQPNDAETMKRKAIDSFKADDLTTAWGAISAASQLAPNDPEVFNDMGLIAKKRGDIAKARESYQKAIQLKEEYPEALNNLAMIEKDGGSDVKARELLEKALKITPAYPEANFNLAVLYDKSGDRAKAVEYYKRFLEVSGQYPNNIVESVRDRVMEIEPQ